MESKGKKTRYPISSLKHQLNNLGVFGVSFMEEANSSCTNVFYLSAKQWVGGSEVKHRIPCLTLKEGLAVLLERAASIKMAIDSVRGIDFAVPDSNRNMIGQIEDGNFEIVGDFPL